MDEQWYGDGDDGGSIDIEARPRTPEEQRQYEEHRDFLNAMTPEEFDAYLHADDKGHEVESKVIEEQAKADLAAKPGLRRREVEELHQLLHG